VNRVVQLISDGVHGLIHDILHNRKPDLLPDAVEFAQADVLLFAPPRERNKNMFMELLPNIVQDLFIEARTVHRFIPSLALRTLWCA
jgi:hypothetical protein